MLPSSKRQILSLEKEAHIFQTHEYYPDSIAQMGRAEVLILMKSNLPVFSFVDHAFGVASKKLSPNIRSLRFSPVLSSMSSIVLYFTFRSMGYFELIFVKGVSSGSIFSLSLFFACGCPVVPAPFVEKTILSFTI